MPKKCGFAEKHMILTLSLILFLPLLPSPKAAGGKLVPVFSTYQQSGLRVCSNCITNIVTLPPPSLSCSFLLFEIALDQGSRVEFESHQRI